MNIINIPKSLHLLRRFEFPKKLGLLEKIYGKKLKAMGKGYIVCSNGILWRLDLTDPCHRWIVYGKYEGGAGIDFAIEKLKNGGVYVDSGANIGQWLLYIAGLDGVKTIAFEPVTTERDWLLGCIGMYPKWDVSVLSFGLSSKEATLEIQKDCSRSTLQLDWYQDQDLERETIKVCRLDKALEDHNVEKITFWKLDVEGAELEALKGAEKYLRENTIEYIYFECHPSNYEKIREFLALYNYGVFELIDGKLIPKIGDVLVTEDLVATLRT